MMEMLFGKKMLKKEHDVSAPGNSISDFTLILTETFVMGDGEIVEDVNLLARISTGFLVEATQTGVCGHGTKIKRTSGLASLYQNGCEVKRDVGLECIAKIYHCLESMGFGETNTFVPDICGVVDTSICHGSVTLQGTMGVNKHPFHYSFWLMHSGATGEHLGQFVLLFSIISELFKGSISPKLLSYVSDTA